MGSEVIKLAMKETEKAGFREGYLSAIYSYLELAKGFEEGSKEARAIMDFSTNMITNIMNDPDGFMEKYSIKKEGVA